MRRALWQCKFNNSPGSIVHRHFHQRVHCPGWNDPPNGLKPTHMRTLCKVCPEPIACRTRPRHHLDSARASRASQCGRQQPRLRFSLFLTLSPRRTAHQGVPGPGLHAAGGHLMTPPSSSSARCAFKQKTSHSPIRNSKQICVLFFEYVSVIGLHGNSISRARANRQAVPRGAGAECSLIAEAMLGGRAE